MNNFEELKAEIIRRGYESNACDAIHDAEDADTMEAFFDVVKDNFNWCFYKGVVDVPMIEANKELFNAVHIYANEVHRDGYCLIDGDIDAISVLANIYVCDNAIIKQVCDNATINYVCDNAIIKQVCDNATINYVCDNATINKVYGNATVNSWLYLSCNIKDNAVLRVMSTNTLYTRMNVEILN